MPFAEPHRWIPVLLVATTALARSSNLPAQSHASPASTSLEATDPPADPDKGGLFPDGSRTLWLGDSITHACLYTRFLEDYARSRYPRRHLLFVNAGVSADTTANVLVRFDQDVRPWKPTRVFVCLGMNDGLFRSWDPELFANYQVHTRELLDRLQALGSDVRLLSPTPVDGRSRLRKSMGLTQIPEDYVLVLARMRDWLAGEARRRKIVFTDLLAPLQKTQALLHLENPGASLFPDGVHPNAAGHALMALRILATQGEVEPRWSVTIPGQGKPEVEGGRIAGFERTNGGLRFRFRAASLPWVLPPSAMAAAALDPAYRKINQCRIRIGGLPEGFYEMRVDGSSLCKGTAREWSVGVDIGLLRHHPDWLQSLRITEENALRSTYIYKGITDLWIARHKVHALATNGKTGKANRKQTKAEVDRITHEILQLAEKISTSDAWLTRIRNPLDRSYEIRRLR